VRAASSAYRAGIGRLSHGPERAWVPGPVASSALVVGARGRRGGGSGCGASLVARHLVLRDDGGDVVSSALLIRKIHQDAALLARTTTKGQGLRNALVVHHVGQAVGAQQQTVAVGQPEVLDVDVGSASARADGVREDVSQILTPALHRDWPASVREILAAGVIASQSREDAIPQEVRA